MAAAGKYALSTTLDEPITFDGKPLVIQYDVTYNDAVTCGGSYFKLLSKPEGAEFDSSAVDDKTAYTIMFGPDKCGMDAKYHFIFRHKNPNSGEFREVHAMKVADAQALLFSDKKSHLVTLIIKPDNTFMMKVDNKPTLSGKLGSDDEFDPALTPAKKVDDPDDSKPEDWVDAKMMDDPEESKPDDWVNEDKIDDPTAEQPEGWDEDMDGEWEAPTIKNPDYKGEWAATQIDNPDYKGVWAPAQLENPDYFEETDPYSKLTPIAAVTFELLANDKGYTFDNLLITDNEQEAEDVAAATWVVKKAAQNE